MSTTWLQPDHEAEVRTSLSEVYHENSKIRNHHWWTADGRSLTNGPHYRQLQRRLQRLQNRWTETPRRFPHATMCHLPPVADVDLPSLSDVIVRRRSQRTYGREPITLNQLATLLHFSYGVTGDIPLGQGRRLSLRATPSGGALYPVEIYPLVLNVEGLAAGVYHYAPVQHTLERLPQDIAIDSLIHATCEAPMADASCVFVLTAVFARQSMKYGDRAYRLTLLDTGCVVEHLYLLSTALSLCGCVYSGFIDDEINAIVGADGGQESALAIFAVGTPPPTDMTWHAPRRHEGRDGDA